MARQTQSTAHPVRGQQSGSSFPQPRKMAQILPAARDLFLEYGFDHVSMDMVVARSGVSKATLYVYFASKEELFAAAVDEEVRQLADRFDIARRCDESIEDALRKSARSFVDFFLSERAIALQRTVYGVLSRFPDLGVRIYEEGPKAVVDRVAALIAVAQEDGSLKSQDPVLAAKQFMSLVRDDFDLAGLLMMPRPEPSAIDRSIDESIEMFMARYGAS